MHSVFLSHSSRDKPFVRNLAAHLRQHPEISVWLDETQIAPGANIVTQISAGLDSEFVLFILSPDSVNSRWVAEEWSDAFWQQTNEGRIKLATVLYRDCPIPRLLGNKQYFDLRTNHPAGFRQIATWLLTQQPAPPPRINPLPTRPPLFIGRESGLAFLHTHLQPGVVLGLSGMHKKEEAICLELGNKDGLRASYGNQALILEDRGKLDEALALFTELKMPRQRDAVAAELAQPRTAAAS